MPEFIEVDAAGVAMVVSSHIGPTVLFVHGLASRWQVFSSVMLGLVPDVRVAALDLPGHGSSDRATALYSVRGFARSVLAAVDRLGTPAVLVGHSAGGWASLQAAADHPGAVTGLVLVDSPLDLASIDRTGFAQVVAAPTLLRSLSPSLASVDHGVLEALRDGSLLAGYEPRQLLRRLECPLTVVQAAADRGGLMTNRDVSMALSCLRQPRRHVAVDSGHAVPVEAPEVVVDVVRTVLSTGETSARIRPPAAHSEGR